MYNYLIILILFILTSCASYVETDVSSFSNIKNFSQQKKYFIQPSELQMNSIEFQNYANSISNRIDKSGWKRVSNINEANFIITFNYQMGGSETIAGSVPIYGQTGGGYSTSTGSYSSYGYGTGSYGGTYTGTTYSPETYGVIGSSSYNYESNQRIFNLVIADKNNRPVYEVYADSRGSSRTFGAVAECIFDSALKKFPNEDNYIDEINIDECGIGNTFSNYSNNSSTNLSQKIDDNMPNKTVTERYKDLNTLREQGLITDDEYFQKVELLLSEM